MANGWNRAIQQMGGQVPDAWRGNGQNQRQDLRDYRQQQRRRVGAPTETTTTTTSPAWANNDARDQTWQQWQETVANLGGAPMSYYDYAQANSGGATTIPTAVNGIRMEAAPGTINLGGAVDTTAGATFGAPEPVTVTQTFNNTPAGGGYRGNGPGGRRDQRRGR